MSIEEDLGIPDFDPLETYPEEDITEEPIEVIAGETQHDED